MADPQVFDYSITCSVCGNTYSGQAETPFQHMAAARTAGWDVREIIENKPIKCPVHK